MFYFGDMTRQNDFVLHRELPRIPEKTVLSNMLILSKSISICHLQFLCLSVGQKWGCWEFKENWGTRAVGPVVERGEDGKNNQKEIETLKGQLSTIQYSTIQLNEDVTIAVDSQFKQLRSSLKKDFWGFNGIQTHGLCVSAAVFYQLSYEDPHIGSRPYTIIQLFTFHISHFIHYNTIFPFLLHSSLNFVLVMSCPDLMLL